MRNNGSWMYTCTPYLFCRRWYMRREEVKRAEKLLTSWKKEEAIEGQVTLALVYTDMVERKETFTLRHRKGWQKEHFFKDGDTPIIRSAKLRGQERWEEKLEEDANVIKRQEVQWEKEGDEKWIFAQRPSDATREKWGLETASEESSSEESSSGDSDDGEEL